MTDVDVVTPKGENYTIYVAGASGGVWKTINEGTTWEPVFEHAASTSIGDITLVPSDPDIVWIGTGEANIFRSSMAGAGVYKSVDAGQNWQYMGLAGTHTIPRIVIHPSNPDIVYVAASGHEWTDNKERGVYKSTDGGTTWEKMLYINERTGAIDLVMDPSDTHTLYAATWQRIRLKWNDPRNEPGYSESAIYKTTDDGETWAQITDGLPEARYRGRIGIDVSRSNPNVVYAFVDNYEIAREADEEEEDSYGRPRGGVIRGATVYRSDDKGEHWRQVSETDTYMERLSATYGWVFGQMRVDPNDENKIYLMGLSLNVSEDGGKTFHRLSGMHGDHHGLWIDPDNSDYLVNVNDGGVVISYDGGENWKNYTDDFPLVQFFNVGYDMDDPFHVYGSIQDHGSRRGIVDLSLGRDRIPAVDWENAPGGEGSTHAVDPTDPNIVYSAGFYGTITRTDMGTGESTNILPRVGEGEPRLRGQWIAPFIISPHNPRIIYHGMNYLYRSMNRGESWDRISPDLTYDNPEELGDIQYQTLYSISESPFKFGRIYVGTDDGRVHVTHNSGESWTELATHLPRKKFITGIVASAYDEATVYLAMNGKRDDDFAAYLWKSTDYGRTWEDISNNIPCGPINVIREDPKRGSVLYVGTDLGVYVSLDGGTQWHVLPADMPTTFVHDLIIHPREDILVAATHGRGMYALDARYIQTLAEESDEPAVLFDMASVPLRRGRSVSNASIYYYIREAQEVTVQIKNMDGTIQRELESTGDAGINVTTWDLMKNGSEEEETNLVGIGTYTVVLIAGDVSVEKSLEVTR